MATGPAAAFLEPRWPTPIRRGTVGGGSVRTGAADWPLPPPRSPIASPRCDEREPFAGRFRSGAYFAAPLLCALTSSSSRRVRRRAAALSRRLLGRVRRHAARDRLQDTEIRAAMQLPPEALEIVPGEEVANGRDSRSDLRGTWLNLFRNSAPYIAMFRNTVMVFHIPGHLLNDTRSAELEGLLGDITLCTLLGVKPVLVVAIEGRILQRATVEGLGGEGGAPVTLQSLPYEDDVLRMVKEEVGIVLAELEGVLGRLGRYVQGRRRSVGPSPAVEKAADADDEDETSFHVYASSMLVSAAPFRTTDGVAGGLLGRVYKVDVQQIRRRLQDNDLVVLMPVGTCAGGDVRCVSSEQLATEVAKQMKAAKLVFFTRGQHFVDTRRRGLPVATIQVKDASEWVKYAKEKPEILQDELARELLSYVELLIEALALGTRRGHLLDSMQGSLLQELYTTDGRGTLVSQDLYDGLRLADASDVGGILGLTMPLVEKGLLKKRSGYEVERSCSAREMFVWKRDDQTLGCASLECFDDAPDMAELGCFVVSEACRGKGHGTVLLAYIERVAVLQGLRTIFLLTTQTMQWFEERGFRSTSVDKLPECKRKSYDVTRSSKVYMKNLDEIPSSVMERFSFVEVDTLE
mmetsp:Transcript_103258/g.296394  ORF Transcript_103258/g.296394 Transcript_103258/m.296394 type:complete len:634 (-) Transcript_103258:41-1942(-)